MNNNKKYFDKHLDEMLKNYCSREVPYTFRVKDNTAEKRNKMNIKRIIKKAGVCLCGAAIISAGIFSANIFGGTGGGNDNSFVMTVNAAEITDNNQSAVIDISSTGISYSEGDNGSVEYFFRPTIKCTGDNISTITYTANHGKIDFVKSNVEFVQKRTKKGMKESILIKDTNPEFAEEPSMGNTIKYSEQNDKNLYLNVTGNTKTLSKDNQKLISDNIDDLFGWVYCDDKSTLTVREVNEKIKKYLDILLDDLVITCTVKFNDGTQQSQQIKVGTKIMKAKDVYTATNDEAVPVELPPEKYDYEDVFLTFTKI